jgi:hypothetical protein
MAMGLGRKLNPSCVMGFLMGGFCICDHGFGMAKPSGFVPIAISTYRCSRLCRSQASATTVLDFVNRQIRQCEGEEKESREAMQLEGAV